MDTTTNTTSLPDNILIENEAKLSKKYILKKENSETEEPKILELTPDNVARVEAMIKYDSTYARSGDMTAKARYKPRSREIEYGGSTAFWMSLLKKALEDPNKLHERYKAEGDEYSYTYYEILAGAIAAVDRENSTHLTSDGVGRITILDRLANYKRDELKLNLGKVDLGLFKAIADETDTGIENRKSINEAWKQSIKKEVFSLIAASEDNKKYDKRFNPSFASKFCHYACFYIFDDAKKDNYPIYDTILRKVLPRYLRYFKLNEAVNRTDWDWDIAKTKNIDDIVSGYEEYCKAIKRIREVAGKKWDKISGNGFDHLLWYYHKNEG